MPKNGKSVKPDHLLAAGTTSSVSPDDILAAGTVQEPKTPPGRTGPATVAAPAKPETAGTQAQPASGEQPAILTERNREAITRPRRVSEPAPVSGEQIDESSVLNAKARGDQVLADRQAVDRVYGAGTYDQGRSGSSPEDMAQVGYASRQELAIIAAQHRADLATKALKQKLTGEDHVVRTAVKDPKGLASNIAQHFGPDAVQQMSSLPAAQQRKMIVIATYARNRDKVKYKAQIDADPNFQPPQDATYQAKLRDRIPGLSKAVTSAQAQIPAEGGSGNFRMAEDRAMAKTGASQGDVRMYEGAEAEQARKAEIIRTEMARQGPGLPSLTQRLQQQGIDPSTVRRTLAQTSSEPQTSIMAPPEQNAAEVQRFREQNRAEIQMNAKAVSNREADNLRAQDPGAVRTMLRALSPGFLLSDTARGEVALGETGPKVLGELSDTFADLLHFVDTGAGTVKGNDYVDTAVSKIRDFGAYMRGRGDVTPKGAAESGIKAGAGMLSAAEKYEIEKGITGLPFWAIMGGEAALQTQGQPIHVQAEKTAENILFGAAIEFGPGMIAKAFGKLPGPLGAMAKKMPNTVGLGATSTGFGGLAAYETYKNGGTLAEVIGAGLGAGVGVAAMGATGIVPEVARAGISMEGLPEPVRDKLADIVGFGKGLVRSSDGRNLSLYKDPQSGGVGGHEISSEQAVQYDPAVFFNKKTGRPATMDVTPEQYEQILARVKGTITPPDVSKGLPNRPPQLEAENRAPDVATGEKSPTPASKEPELKPQPLKTEESAIKQPTSKEDEVSTTQTEVQTPNKPATEKPVSAPAQKLPVEAAPSDAASSPPPAVETNRIQQLDALKGQIETSRNRDELNQFIDTTFELRDRINKELASTPTSDYETHNRLNTEAAKLSELSASANRTIADLANEGTNQAQQGITNTLNRLFTRGVETAKPVGSATKQLGQSTVPTVADAAKIALEPPDSVLARLNFGKETPESVEKGVYKTTTARGKEYTFDLHTYKLADGRERLLLSAGDPKELVDAGAIVRPVEGGVIVETLHGGETGFDGLGGVLARRIAKRYGKIIPETDAPLSPAGRKATEKLAARSSSPPVEQPAAKVDKTEAEVPSTHPVSKSAAKEPAKPEATTGGRLQDRISRAETEIMKRTFEGAPGTLLQVQNEATKRGWSDEKYASELERVLNKKGKTNETISALLTEGGSSDPAHQGQLPGEGTLPGGSSGAGLRPRTETETPQGAQPTLAKPDAGHGQENEDVARTVDEAAHEAATSPENDLPQPTQGQKDAVNYRLGHERISGLDISFENPGKVKAKGLEGSERSGVDPNGKPWSVKLKSHYGYIRSVQHGERFIPKSKDKEHVDIFVKPGTPLDYNGPIFVVNQTRGNGHFDEHKTMLGWKTEAEAKAGYLANYEKGWDRIHSIARFENPSEFKDWLKNEDQTKPAEQAQAESAPLSKDPKQLRKRLAEIDAELKAPARMATGYEARKAELQAEGQRVVDAIRSASQKTGAASRTPKAEKVNRAGAEPKAKPMARKGTVVIEPFDSDFYAQVIGQGGLDENGTPEGRTKHFDTAQEAIDFARQHGYSYIVKKSDIEDAAAKKIRAAPSYPAIQKAYASFRKSIYGHLSPTDEAELRRDDAEPWKYLTAHSGVMNAKSARAKTLERLADEIFAQTKLPRRPMGKFRGDNGVDWDKLITQHFAHQKPAAVEPVKETIAKEPWQMRRGEFLSDRIGQREEGVTSYGSDVRSETRGILERGFTADHEKMIARAVSEGKPVPPEVLADYPDLAPVKEVAAKSIASDPGQRGSVGLTRAPTGYEGAEPSAKLSDLSARIRGAWNALRGREGTARRNFSTVGSLMDIYVRGLSQLEKANRPTFEATLEAAGARTTAMMVMRRGAQKVQDIMRTKDGWLKFLAARYHARLQGPGGIKDRWLDLQNLAQTLPEEELQEFYTGGEEGGGVRPIMQMLEGMPFGKQFKLDEGFDPEDSVTGIVDSLFASDDINAARSYLQMMFGSAADSVASIMDDDDYQELIASKEFKEANPVFDELIGKPLAHAHSLNEGIFSDANGPFGYIPLTSLDAEGGILHRLAGVGKRGQEYRKPQNMRNKFATGLSPEYDVSPEALGKAITESERRNTIAKLLAVGEKEGLFKTLKRNEPAPREIEYQGETYRAQVVAKGKDRTILKDGKAIHVAAPRMAVPDWLYQELKPILEAGDYSQGGFAKFMQKMNLFGMAGPIDASAHLANIIGATIVGTPYVGTNILSKTIGNTPVTKMLNTWLQMALIDPWSEESVKDIQEMSQIGAMPSRYGTIASGWTAKGRDFAGQTGAKKKYLSLTPVLYGPAGIDIRARLMMYRGAKLFAPNATKGQMRHYLNMLGNYNHETIGRVEKFLKKYGIAPFYTAGSTMWRNGILATFGATPLPTNGETLSRRLTMRIATMLSGGIVGMLVAWVMIYKAYTGKFPWDDPRAKLLQFPLNEKHRQHWLAKKIYGDNDKTAYVGMGFFSPLIERGLRGTGIAPAINAYHAGATKGQASEEAEREIVNSIVHPFVSGPITHSAIVTATTKEPYITNLRDFTGRRTIELLPGTKTTEPGLSTLKARGIEGVANLNNFYGRVAQNIGLVQRTFDLSEGHAAKEDQTQPNPWLRMALDLAFPRLIKGPTDTGKGEKKFTRQEKATESSIRRDAGGPAPRRGSDNPNSRRRTPKR
jgi:hypothetical protein